MAKRKKKKKNEIIEVELFTKVEEETIPIEINEDFEIIEEFESIEESNYEESFQDDFTEEKKEQPKNLFTFKFVKRFGKRFDINLIERIKQDSKYLKQICELEISTMDDDCLLSVAKEIYPNIGAINNEARRAMVEEMLLSVQDSILSAYGDNRFLYNLENNEEYILVFYDGEIVGSAFFGVENAYTVYLVVNLRGTDRIKAMCAVEMCNFLLDREAEEVYKNGYSFIRAITMTKKHSSLVRKVYDKEYARIETELKIEGKSDKEIQANAKRLCPGFKNTGTILYRKFAGQLVKEHNWEYDLRIKFNEFFNKQ